MEERRLRAARHFAAGEAQSSIAREVHVSRQSVSRWYRRWKRGGAAALGGVGRAGRKPRLNRQQQQRLAAALQRGPRAHGFGSDRWTLNRVVLLIEQFTGVLYHRGHVCKILGGMGWKLQRGR